MAASWEIAAHSAACDVVSKYKYLIVNLVFPFSVFEVKCWFIVTKVDNHVTKINCILVFGQNQ